MSIPAYAMLDIFDHPKEAEEKKAVLKKSDQRNVLDYSNDCFLKEDYKEALKSCQNLLNYEPAREFKGRILYLMGLSCLKMERFLEARSYFNDVILMEKEAEDLKIDAYFGIGDSYFLEENYDKAFDAYNQISLKYSPAQIGNMLYYRFFETLNKMGRPEEAKLYLNKLQTEYPLSFEARLAGNFFPGTPPEVDKKEDVFYSVQVGCFNEKKNADELCERLVRNGFEARIYESQDADEPRFRVKVGRCGSNEEAQSLERKLKRVGYPTKVCP